MFAPDASAPLSAWVLAPASLAALGLAGHLATRAFPSPCRPATAFVAALLVLFFTTLACDGLGVRLSLPALGLGLALAALPGLLLARRAGLPPPRFPAPPRLGPRRALRELWWALPCALAFGSVLARGVLDPLAGWDNLWRWNHLALVMHDAGSLASYPPVTGRDFLVYPWCDGIPPLVAISNLWIYLAAGSTHGGLVVFRLALELALTAALVWRIAGDLWGPRGARFALLALAASPLFLASVSIAQETGLAGVAVLALVRCALAYRREPRRSTALWLGACAALAALCRDYNLLFLPVALALLALLRAPRRDLAAAAALMLLLAVPWYARNAWRTGNPLFSHDLAGLWPVNPYHDYLMGEIRRFWSPAAVPGFARTLAAALAAGCGGLVLAAAPSLRRPGVVAACLALPAAAVVALWALSVPATAGGVVYSLRALAPALPLLAVAAGGWAARSARVRVIAAALLAVVAVDAARRHWIFFLNPLAPPVSCAWTDWQPADSVHARFSREKLWTALAASGAGGAIVADNPSYTVLGARRGVAVTPLESPALAALTDTTGTADAETTRLALLAAGVRFVVLGEDTTFGRGLHAGHPRIGPLYARPPVGRFEGLRVYDLRIPFAAPDPAP